MFGEKTCQAIYQAIKNGRLKAIYEEKKWWVTKEALIRYHETKYSRMETKFQGEPLYDLDNGEMSVGQAAKLSGLKQSYVYILLRQGKLRAKKKGNYWIVRHEDVLEFHKERMEAKENPKQMKFA